MSLATTWSTMPAGHAAPAYASLILERAHQGMLDNDWTVDWDEAPTIGGFHPGAHLRTMTLPRLRPGPQRSGAGASIEAITDGLHLAYAPTALRLSVNLNDTASMHSRSAACKWGRTTASGGGRYCMDFYLVQGVGGDLPPGIHRYSPVHNGWEHLDPHDRTEDLRRIQRYPMRAHRYLCYSINYWQSAFKYNDFAYQATAMDAGTVIGSLHALWGAHTAGTWDMEVDEPGLADLLGLDARDDGVYAVQAWAGPAAGLSTVSTPGPVRGGRNRIAAHRGGGSPQRLPTTVALQRDMAAEKPRRRQPPPPVRHLDPPADSERRIAEALTRETSFGRFTGAPVGLDALRTVLAAGSEAAAALTDDPEVTWAYLVYATAVDGLDPGLYRCSAGSETFVPLRAGAQEPFLSSTYFLKNYDGRRAAATVVVCASVFRASREHGVHGYRFTNAVAGACCQGVSTGAVRAGLGTGTALGFDARAHADHAGLDPEEISPLLMIMVGSDDPRAGRVAMQVTRRS